MTYTPDMNKKPLLFEIFRAGVWLNLIPEGEKELGTLLDSAKERGINYDDLEWIKNLDAGRLSDYFGAQAISGDLLNAMKAADAKQSEYMSGCAPEYAGHGYYTSALQIGDPDDGGVYVGLSASDGMPLHAALADLPVHRTYEEALAAADRLKAEHPTAHVPTPEELDKNLFDNRFTGKLAGTFNTNGTGRESCYRSSAPSSDNGAEVQYFTVGVQCDDSRDDRFPVRLVW